MAGDDAEANVTHSETQEHDAAWQRTRAARVRDVWPPLILALARIDEVDAVRAHMPWTMMSDVDIVRGVLPRVIDPALRQLVANLPAYYARRFESAADDPEVHALEVLASVVL